MKCVLNIYEEKVKEYNLKVLLDMIIIIYSFFTCTLYFGLNCNSILGIIKIGYQALDVKLRFKVISLQQNIFIIH